MKQKMVIFLCDLTGIAGYPWLKAGYVVVLVDPQHGEDSREGNLIKIAKTVEGAIPVIRDLVKEYEPVLLMGFPPCTDLAVSGAAHFKSKREKDLHFQAKAFQIVLQCQIVAEMLGVPYAIENPVSVLASMWRKPDFSFHPYEFGGYLPEDDEHPLYPQYITPRDAYPKKTCLWTGGGFKIPGKQSVIPIKDYPGWTKLGGRSLKTKNIRSATPRGFAQAVFENYNPQIETLRKFKMEMER